MLDSEQDDTVSVSEINEAEDSVKLFLVNNSGTAFSKERIVDELDGVERSDVYSRPSMSRPYPFHAVNDKGIGTAVYYYAEIDWFAVVMTIISAATLLALFFGWVFGYI